MIQVVVSDFFLKYITPVYVELNDKRAAIIYRLLQICFISFIIALITRNASWNAKESGISSVFINVEGVDNITDGLVFDAIDIVKPPQENEAFFITTKLFNTTQKQATCSDLSEKADNLCTKDENCPIGRKSKNGINTGQCSVSNGVCQIIGWCPVEDLSQSSGTVIYRLSDIDNLTVYIRNNIEFFEFDRFRTNFNFTNENLTCFYDPVTSPLCPIFRIKSMLDSLNIKFEDVKEKGAIIGIFIKWICYFNLYSKPCNITYTFKRLGKDETGAYVGYKYKYAEYHQTHRTKYRFRYTARGLRFLVIVGSSGYKFNSFVLFSSIGSILAYFVPVSLVAYYFFYCCLFSEKQQKLLYRTDLSHFDQLTECDDSVYRDQYIDQYHDTSRDCCDSEKHILMEQNV